jgi:HTH-type transcriptional regulator/antitoxin HigA
MEEMTVLEPIAADIGAIDRKRYGQLLARFTPKVIETEAEHNAALAIVESLMEKGGDNLSREECTLLDLLSDLIGRFEEKIYEPMAEAAPLEVLRELMEANALKAADLAGTLGGRSRVSEILAGKRAISKEQARRLGERFRVSPAVFI